jgi:xanthine dehydrogenase accessory factor
MAVNEAGEVTGSVSGGCVEGAVVTEALDVLAGAGEPRMVTFGYSDDEAFAVGLTCGGTIHLLIEPLTWDDGVRWETVRDLLRAEEPLALVSVMEGPHSGARLLVRPDGTVEGSLGDPDLDRVVSRDAMAELAAGRTLVRHYGACGQANEETVAVFIESFARPPRMIIFGAVDFTASLARAAKLLGYRVTVCDAREVFATRARFPMADEVEVDWPDRLLARLGPELGPEDAVCVLTHDPKFDVPAIIGALESRVGYLGVMGSRNTHEKRMQRLAEEGITDPAQLARIMAPIGLDIGARSPEETAVAVCAEIIALRTGHPARSLRDSDGPIHRDPIAR